jgi:hypothetical protein
LDVLLQLSIISKSIFDTPPAASRADAKKSTVMQKLFLSSVLVAMVKYLLIFRKENVRCRAKSEAGEASENSCRQNIKCKTSLMPLDKDKTYIPNSDPHRKPKVVPPPHQSLLLQLPLMVSHTSNIQQ